MSAIAPAVLRAYVWNTEFNGDRWRSTGHASLELEYNGKKNYLSHWPGGGGLARNRENWQADYAAENHKKEDNCYILILTPEQAQNVDKAMNNIKEAVKAGKFKYSLINDPGNNSFNCSGMVEKLLSEQMLISKEYAEMIKAAPENSFPNRVTEGVKDFWKNRDIITSTPTNPTTLRSRL